MAKLESAGFCSESCEIDDYYDSLMELQTAVTVEEALDPESKRLAAARMVAEYYQDIVNSAQESALVSICPGYARDDNGMIV